MNVISIVMLLFSVVGAVDYLTGNHLGVGKEFERGILIMGTMIISMVGMIVLAPLIAAWIEPVLRVVSDRLPFFEPSVIAGSLLANDMGGAPLSMELAKTESAGYFNGLVVGSMMGATISFSLPLALGVTKPEQRNSVMLGLMAGIAAIPVGCIASGLMLGMSPAELAMSVVPLALFSVVLTIGLLKIPRVCIKIFNVFGIVIKTIIVIGLLVGIAEFTLGFDIPHTAPVEEGVMVCFNATAVMTGAFPLLAILSRLIKRPMKKISERVGMNEVSALGFVGTLATNVTTFGMMRDMDDKGVVLNSAFAVSAAFTFAGHLAFTMSFNGEYVLPVMIGKLVAGICAVAVAQLLYAKMQKRV
ncbi:MAG: ethanolamine utilization protein EutH [Ruminococcaceae bacterium]|nr:ethanolamine utilization protein EutH [Oscillospiraceae bacterium]